MWTADCTVTMKIYSGKFRKFWPTFVDVWQGLHESQTVGNALGRWWNVRRKDELHMRDREFLPLLQHKNRRTRRVVCVEFEKLSAEKRNPWDWLLCGVRTCVPERWNSSVRSTGDWKDGQTDRQWSLSSPPTNKFRLRSFFFFFGEPTRCSTIQKKKILEFYGNWTWISVFVRDQHCYF